MRPRDASVWRIDSLAVLAAATIVCWPVSLLFVAIWPFGCAGRFKRTYSVFVNLGFVYQNAADAQGPYAGAVYAARRQLMLFHYLPTAALVIAVSAGAVALAEHGQPDATTDLPGAIAWHMLWLQLLFVFAALIARRMSLAGQACNLQHLCEPGSTMLTFPTNEHIAPLVSPAAGEPSLLIGLRLTRRSEETHLLTLSEAAYGALRGVLESAGRGALMPDLAALRSACPDGVVRTPSGSAAIAFRPLAATGAPNGVPSSSASAFVRPVAVSPRSTAPLAPPPPWPSRRRSRSTDATGMTVSERVLRTYLALHAPNADPAAGVTTAAGQLERRSSATGFSSFRGISSGARQGIADPVAPGSIAYALPAGLGASRSVSTHRLDPYATEGSDRQLLLPHHSPTPPISSRQLMLPQIAPAVLAAMLATPSLRRYAWGAIQHRDGVRSSSGQAPEAHADDEASSAFVPGGQQASVHVVRRRALSADTPAVQDSHSNTVVYAAATALGEHASQSLSLSASADPSRRSIWGPASSRTMFSSGRWESGRSLAFFDARHQQHSDHQLLTHRVNTTSSRLPSPALATQSLQRETAEDRYTGLSDSAQQPSPQVPSKVFLHTVGSNRTRMSMSPREAGSNRSRMSARASESGTLPSPRTPRIVCNPLVIDRDGEPGAIPLSERPMLPQSESALLPPRWQPDDLMRIAQARGLVSLDWVGASVVADLAALQARHSIRVRGLACVRGCRARSLAPRYVTSVVIVSVSIFPSLAAHNDCFALSRCRRSSPSICHPSGEQRTVAWSRFTPVCLIPHVLGS